MYSYVARENAPEAINSIIIYIKLLFCVPTVSVYNSGLARIGGGGGGGWGGVGELCFHLPTD